MRSGSRFIRCKGGLTPRPARVLRDFGGDSVLETVEDFRTNIYRAVYTVQFAEVVYVLHVFKRSRRGARKRRSLK